MVGKRAKAIALLVGIVAVGLVVTAGLKWREIYYAFGPFGKPFVVKDPGIEMLWVQPGTFWMGSPEDEAERRGDEVRHRVTLTRGFWLGKYEVTQAQYEAVTGGNPSNHPDAGPRAPVETVSWMEAVAFCQELTHREREARRLPRGYEYALPTEAQWEYACRAGTETARYGSLDEIAWYIGNSEATTHPVGEKGPNAWGFHDMLGNVYEWCHDRYDNYPQEGVAEDPSGPDAGSGPPNSRTLRGGAWILPTPASVTPGSCCRAAARRGITRSTRMSFTGFRLALRPVGE